MTAEVKESATAATKSWAQAMLLINGKKVEWGTKPLLFRGEENIVTVEAPDEIARELNLVLPEDGGLNIVASPTFGSWVARVNGKFEWKIKPDADRSGRITLVFYSREMLKTWELQSLVMSSNLADEAELYIDGVRPPAGDAEFISGVQRKISLRAKSNSPISSYPLTLAVSYIELLPGDVSCSPPALQLTTDHTWHVAARNRKGQFGLIAMDEVGGKITTQLRLPCRAI